MLPPATVGGVELTRSDVSSATPVIPMNGSIANSRRWRLPPGNTARCLPRILRTGVNTETLWKRSGCAALASGSGFGVWGNSPGSAPLPWRFEMTP